LTLSFPAATWKNPRSAKLRQHQNIWRKILMKFLENF